MTLEYIIFLIIIGVFVYVSINIGCMFYNMYVESLEKDRKIKWANEALEGVRLELKKLKKQLSASENMYKDDGRWRNSKTGQYTKGPDND